MRFIGVSQHPVLPSFMPSFRSLPLPATFVFESSPWVLEKWLGHGRARNSWNVRPWSFVEVDSSSPMRRADWPTMPPRFDIHRNRFSPPFVAAGWPVRSGKKKKKKKKDSFLPEERRAVVEIRVGYPLLRWRKFRARARHADQLTRRDSDWLDTRTYTHAQRRVCIGEDNSTTRREDFCPSAAAWQSKKCGKASTVTLCPLVLRVVGHVKKKKKKRRVSQLTGGLALCRAAKWTGSASSDTTTRIINVTLVVWRQCNDSVTVGERNIIRKWHTHNTIHTTGCPRTCVGHTGVRGSKRNMREGTIVRAATAISWAIAS